jgi:hypothetical protein
VRVRPRAAAERLHRASQADGPLAWIGVAPDDNAVNLIEPPLECDKVEPARPKVVAEFEWIRGTRFEIIAVAAATAMTLGAPRPQTPRLQSLPEWG